MPETPEGADAQTAENQTAADPPAEGSESSDVAAEASEADAVEGEAPESEVSEEEAPRSEDGSEAVAEAAPVAHEPGVELSAKQRRRRVRSKSGEQARPSRSPEERHAERLLERRTKAVRRRARRLQERAKATERRAAAPAAQPLAPVHAPVEGKRKVRQGIVVSDKAEKTITVRIDVARRHRRYEKIVRSSNTLHAHDENNDAHEGDVVRVIESRPLSRTKRWKLIDVLERAR